MDTSFADRLARINKQNTPVEIQSDASAGATRRNIEPSFQKQKAAPATDSFNKRYNAAVIKNLIMGFIWMAITGFATVNIFVIAEYLSSSSGTEEASKTVLYSVVVGLLASFLTFSWVLREAFYDMGKTDGVPLSLAIGCVLGLIAGLGPITVFKELVTMGYL